MTKHSSSTCSGRSSRAMTRCECVELSFEAAGGSTGRAALRLVLADARTSDVRWVGQVKSDSATTFSRALPASLASRLADLVAAP